MCLCQTTYNMHVLGIVFCKFSNSLTHTALISICATTVKLIGLELVRNFSIKLFFSSLENTTSLKFKLCMRT